ncbi:MAG: oligosaccharide flippase family protein [Saprospiraceae bacterium]|nr:oligosaccharide flippase family protein [Saprospiraceae bacterium]
MASTNKNIVSNLAMQAVFLVTQLVLLPFYTNTFGMESYALIGLFVALQAVFVMFDLGMSTTIVQSLASCVSREDEKGKASNLLWTFEIIYWAIGIFIFGIIILFLPFITDQWIGQKGYSQSELEANVLYIAILVVVRFPMSFYMGAMSGLQKQFNMNIILIILEIIKFAGILIVATYINKSVSVFFIVNIVITLFTIIFLRRFIYNEVRTDEGYRFDPEVIKENWKFSISVSLISLAAILVTQTDKFVLGKMVGITEFSIYTLAFTIASLPARIYGAVASAFYPVFIAERSQNQISRLTQVYHRSCQMISILIIPVVLIVIAFMPQILGLWFGDNAKSEALAPFVRILLIGFTLNGFVTMPYYLQMAHRWTKLSIVKNFIALIILLPALYYSVFHFGIIGACWIWCILNAMYFAFEIPIMHTRILKDEQFKYYIQDIGVLLFCGIICSIGLYYFVNNVDIPYCLFFALIIIAVPAQMLLLNRISSEKPLNSFLNYFKSA